MLNFDFSTPLTREQLHSLDAATIKTLRQELHKAYPSLQLSSWWLLGTEGCHLCDAVSDLLHTAILVQGASIAVQSVDIIDFPYDIMHALSHTIPILITSKAIIAYPFSILDLTNHLSK